MIISPLFKPSKLDGIEDSIQRFLNSQSDVMSPDTFSSPRAVGDAMQHILGENFGQLLAGNIKECSANFARRAMADMAFIDYKDFYHVVDIKTHRLDTTFNIPNLTSVERLSRFYEDDKNYFDILLIAYSVNGSSLAIEKVNFVPIEKLDWDCLTIGALGWGQIQIANSNRVLINHSQLRRDWMINLCDKLLTFYPNEILKINKRVEHFTKIKQSWQIINTDI